MALSAVKSIESALRRKGLELESYKPGAKRLYRVVEVDKRTGGIIRTLSWFLTSSELKIWYDGYRR